MLKLLGFVIGATIGVFVVRLNILDSAEIYATSFALDAIKVGAWADARQKFFESPAAWKLAMGLALGGVMGSVIQYFVDRQIVLGRR